MLVALLALVFALVSLLCVALLLRHAFGRSVGTGVMVLCIPCYVLYYAFGQFEHRFKGVIVAGFLASAVLAAVFAGLSVGAAEAAMAQVPKPY